MISSACLPCLCCCQSIWEYVHIKSFWSLFFWLKQRISSPRRASRVYKSYYRAVTWQNNRMCEDQSGRSCVSAAEIIHLKLCLWLHILSINMANYTAQSLPQPWIKLWFGWDTKVCCYFWSFTARQRCSILLNNWSNWRLVLICPKTPEKKQIKTKSSGPCVMGVNVIRFVWTSPLIIRVLLAKAVRKVVQ